MKPLTDHEVARRYLELSYRMVEVACDPDHPASRANGARWRREYEKVQREADRRGLLEPR